MKGVVNRKHFAEVAAHMGYDPAEELITRRNDLAQEASELFDQANTEGDEKLRLSLIDEAKQILKHVEQLDLKMMPYNYARMSSHTVGDSEGNSIMDAFANAIKSNLNASGPATRH